MMLSSINPIQPHHTRLPRRQPRTRCAVPQTCAEESRQTSWVRSDGHLPRSHIPRYKSIVSPNKSFSSSPGAETSGYPDGTTSLVNPKILPPDSYPHALPPPKRKIYPVDAKNEVTLPSAPAAISYPSPHTGPRGHIGPHVTNLPRRRHQRAHKEREYIRQRCLQELFKGSNVWIAFNPRFVEEEDRDKEFTDEEMRELNWMWEGYNFNGVIRVWIGQHDGGQSRRNKHEGQGEELELMVPREYAKTHNDSGISALSDIQLETAATFLAESCRREGGKGRVLITVPASRPVEALSIALLGLSLPSFDSTSYLSKVEFLSGISELEAKRHDNFVISSDEGPFSRRESLSQHTLIQLALWHLHDLTWSEYEDHNDELGLEWRGLLSLDGIEKLEDVTKLSNRFWELFRCLT